MVHESEIQALCEGKPLNQGSRLKSSVERDLRLKAMSVSESLY